MDREWLARRLAEGASYEELARELQRDASTIWYWARKFGLSSSHVRHTNRGGVSRERLTELVDRRLTVREIARELDRSPTTIRHWLDRHGLKTRPLGPKRTRGGIDGLGEEPMLDCPIHGLTRHVMRDTGYRCAKCRSAAVTARRRRRKQTLVDEAGGRCVLCGYDRCLAALQFHHLDPSLKRFAVGGLGGGVSLDRSRAETAKCVLLCANCHAEVENGAADLPV
jgi:transposase-like protein